MWPTSWPTARAARTWSRSPDGAPAQRDLPRKLARWIGRHLELTGISLFFSILIGLPLGILASRGGALGHGLLSLVGMIQTIPSLAVLALPAAHDMDPARLSAFETIMGGTPRIWLGGIIAYGVSTFLNVTIFSWLKGREGSSLLWLRAGIASVLSQIVDTLLFISISFYGVFPIGELLVGQMLAKVVLSIVLVPALLYLLVGIGRRLDRA